MRIDRDGSTIGVKPECIVENKNPKESAPSNRSGGGGSGANFQPPQHMLEEFEDQQQKLTSAAIQLENLSERMANLMREARRTELTKGEVAKTEDGVPMFNQYGRCFILQDKAELSSELEATTTKYQNQIKKTKDTQTYYERQRDETTSNLKEMLANLQQMHAQAQQS